MKRALLLFLVLLTAPSYAAPPRTMEGNPGNVFLKGQKVSITIPAANDDRWICEDYEGTSIAEGTGANVSPGQADVGYYEIWKLGPDGKKQQRTTFAVLAPLLASTPDDTPVALDTAASWFFKDGNAAFGLNEAASLSALAGVGWVRDRLRWRDMEPEKGKFPESTIYDKSAEAFSAQGLKVLQVFHDTPPWAGNDAKFFPDDLRDVYGFLKAMSSRWKGKVHAWEPWNEGDTTNFGGHTGAEMVAFQKAAYHGIRAGNPDAIVCQNVFAQHHRTGVLENFIENLDPGSFDTFNFHHYIQPQAIPHAYREMLPASGSRPIWITESFFHFRQGVKKSETELSVDQRKLRARFLTKNLVTSLNELPQKFFTFVLPHYVEGGILFGLLNEDGTPRADYVALAAAGRLLAGAKPLGQLNGIENAYAFDTYPDGKRKTVVVIWSKKETPLPEALRKAEMKYDFLGRVSSSETSGINPLYLVLPDSSSLDLIHPAWLKPPEIKPSSPLVIQAVLPRDRLKLATSSWLVKQDESLDIPIRVYHFGKSPAEVTLSAEADPALKAALKMDCFTINPEGRWDGILTLTWSGARAPARPMPVKLLAKSNGLTSCSYVLRISTEMGAVTPVSKIPLTSATNETNWQSASSPGSVEFSVTEGTVNVSAKLNEGDRWVYPWLNISPTERPSPTFDGIAFTLTPKVAATYHVMLKEPGGAMYSASLGHVEADENPQRRVVLFSEFDWANYSPQDNNGKLDLAEIESITIGGNPKEENFSYKISNLELVKFAD